MIVKCVRKGKRDLRDKRTLVHYGKYVHLDEEEHLSVGACYIVYGVAIREEFPWYLICEYEEDEYPKPHFSGLFDLIDDRIPPGWSFTPGKTSVGTLAFLPTYWARDPSYLGRLIDGQPDAVRFFKNLKMELNEWHSISE